MTRRITWIILLTVWASFIAIGVTAYFSTRAIILAHLHHAMLDELMAGKRREYNGKWYVTVGSRHSGDRDPILVRSQPEPHGYILGAWWSRNPDEPYRHRNIRAIVYARAEQGGAIEPIEAIYGRASDEFDPLMNRLAIALVIATLVGGIIAAVLARLAAKTSLRPLRATADVIGTIDDRSLDRRIDATRLPTELVPMAEKLNGMLHRLETAVQQRQHFLGDASHELRTPVAALMSALELSTRRPRDLDYYRRLVDECLVDVRHLRRLVEALMDQVKSERPGHAQEWETVELGGLIGECATIVMPLAEKASVTLTSPVEPIGMIRTQPTRLRSVLINLIANAIEHNRPGGSVQVLFEQLGEVVQISVCDTGTGIAPEHLPHLFEPFYRVDRVRQASEHMGLGLFLVHSHVREMGGTCTVQSQPGAGTTFHIRLPGMAVPEAEPASSESSLAPTAAAPVVQRSPSDGHR